MSNYTRIDRLAISFMLLVPSVVCCQELPAPSEDERILQQAGLRTDQASLLKYFRERTLNDAERALMADRVGKLGHSSFRVREKSARALIAAGDASLSFLKPALKDRDAEIARQAEACIRAIERVPHALQTGAAARVLGVRRSPEAAEVLLAYLPFADWEAAGDDLLQALVMVGIEAEAKKPVPAILAAAGDKHPRQRLAAAHVLGHVNSLPLPAGRGGARDALRTLVGDEDPEVRFYAAAAMIRCRDARGVAVLLDLLGTAPAQVLWRTEDLLVRLAGDPAPRFAGKTRSR
jgi:HEAT repeat protein